MVSKSKQEQKQKTKPNNVPIKTFKHAYNKLQVIAN